MDESIFNRFDDDPLVYPQVVRGSHQENCCLAQLLYWCSFGLRVVHKYLYLVYHGRQWSSWGSHSPSYRIILRHDSMAADEACQYGAARCLQSRKQERCIAYLDLLSRMPLIYKRIAFKEPACFSHSFRYPSWSNSGSTTLGQLCINTDRIGSARNG